MTDELIENTRLEISTPGGWKAGLFGIDTKLVLLVLLILLMAFWAFQLNEENKGREVDQYKSTQAMLGVVISNQNVLVNSVAEQKKQSENNFIVQKQNSDSLAEVGYLMTLTPAEREKLNMQMPYTLKRKLNDSGEIR